MSVSPVTYESNWPDVQVKLMRGLREGVAKVGLDVERQIVGNITDSKLVDTGNYRRSWTTATDQDGLEATIGSPVEYGVYLEYGYHQKPGQLYPKRSGNRVIGWGRTSGRFIPARPHVLPAAKSVAARIGQYFRRLDG